MALNDVSFQTRNGTHGPSGANGTPGTSQSRSGGDGGNGAAGQSIGTVLAAQTFAGDPGPDLVNIARTSFGGNVGRGGTGGTGAAAQSVVSDTEGPGFRRRDVDFDQPGNAGACGLAGPGGKARTAFEELFFDMAGGIGSQNMVTLNAVARGGLGGFGGTPSRGGSSSGTVFTESASSGPPAFTSCYDQVGAQGGTSEDGEDGGAGGFGRVEHTNLMQTGAAVLMKSAARRPGGPAGAAVSGRWRAMRAATAAPAAMAGGGALPRPA